MSEEPPQRQLTLRDPREIRALAHPARLEVVTRLQGRQLPMTATELAGYCGLSPSAMSYHLRAMERAGLVERVETSEDGRERPWQLAFERLTVDSAADSPADHVAESLLLEAIMKDDLRHTVDFMAAEPKGPWRSATVLNRGTLLLTTEELAEMLAAIQEVTSRYGEKRRPDRPAGARRVRFSYLAVPDD
ncbi:MAG: ArsR/SmtB family transcription factor [Mycobacteriales bacterium]